MYAGSGPAGAADASDHAAAWPPDVDPTARRVYEAIARYAWDEAECYPSQKLIAHDTGLTRETVNRKIRVLITTGCLRIKDKRWSPRSGWCHNVYELLQPFVVGVPTIKRIVSRAHNTPSRRARRLAARLDHTNTKCGDGRGVRGWCGCRWCRPERASIGRPPPPLPPPSFTESLDRRLRKILGDATFAALDPDARRRARDGAARLISALQPMRTSELGARHRPSGPGPWAAPAIGSPAA